MNCPNNCFRFTSKFLTPLIFNSQTTRPYQQTGQVFLIRLELKLSQAMWPNRLMVGWVCDKIVLAFCNCFFVFHIYDNFFFWRLSHTDFTLQMVYGLLCLLQHFEQSNTCYLLIHSSLIYILHVCLFVLTFDLYKILSFFFLFALFWLLF